MNHFVTVRNGGNVFFDEKADMGFQPSIDDDKKEGSNCDSRENLDKHVPGICMSDIQQAQNVYQKNWNSNVMKGLLFK